MQLMPYFPPLLCVLNIPISLQYIKRYISRAKKSPQAGACGLFLFECGDAILEDIQAGADAILELDPHRAGESVGPDWHE